MTEELFDLLRMYSLHLAATEARNVSYAQAVGYLVDRLKSSSTRLQRVEDGEGDQACTKVLTIRLSADRMELLQAYRVQLAKREESHVSLSKAVRRLILERLSTEDIKVPPLRRAAQ